MYGDSGFRIAAGTLTIAGLDATYDVSRLPRQSDMPTAVLWEVTSTGDVSPGKWHVSLSGKVVGTGNRLSWRWTYLTPNMVAYLRTTFLSGGWSGALTIRDIDRLTGTATVYNCRARLMPPAEQDVNGIGFSNYEMAFFRMTLAV